MTKYLTHEINFMFDLETIAKIADLAKRNDIEAAALLAVAEVESAGVAFWTVGNEKKPAIRFEGHYFYKRLSGEKLKQAIAQGLASKKVGGVKNPKSYAARYQLLERAKKIDANAAMESTSWGLGQVMGANWKDLGYSSVSELVNSTKTVVGQVEVMVRFIIKNGLKSALDNRQWAKFARRYNGPAYKKNAYDTKMAAAHLRYSGKTKVVVDSSPEIMQIQTMLNTVGNYGLKVDGDFGKNSKAALIDFQIKNGLVADGIYGPITSEELQKDYRELTTKKEDIIGKITTLGAGGGAALSEAAKQIEPLAQTSQYLQYLFIALTVGGVLLTLKASILK